MQHKLGNSMDEANMETTIKENSIKMVVHKVDSKILIVKEAIVTLIPISQEEDFEDRIDLNVGATGGIMEIIEETSHPEVTH